MNRIDAYKAAELQRLARRIKLASYRQEPGNEYGRRSVAASPIQVDKSGTSAAMLAKPLRTLFRPEALNYGITMSEDYPSPKAALTSLAATLDVAIADDDVLGRLESEARIVTIFCRLDELAVRFRGYLDAAMAGEHRFDALSWPGDVCLLAYIGARWFFVLKEADGSPLFRIQHIRPSLVYEQFCQAVSPPVAQRAEQSATFSRSNAPVLAQWAKTRNALPRSMLQMLEAIFSANDTAKVNKRLEQEDALHADAVKFFASPAVAMLDAPVNIYSAITTESAIEEMLVWRPGDTKTIKGILTAMRRPETNCVGVFNEWAAKSLLLVVEMPQGSRLFIPDYTVMEHAKMTGGILGYLTAERKTSNFPVSTALVLPPVDSKFVLEAPPERHAVRHREDDTKPDMDAYVLRVRLVD